MRRALQIALVAATGLTGPVAAHPHIFVDAATVFQIDGTGQLTGLRITWTYDAFTSLVMFDQLNLDPDGDGRLDDADRAAIVAGETEWPPDYNGDVHLDLEGRAIAMGRPENGEAWMADDRVSVAFNLPLAEPIASPDRARLRLYDPYYYYAYTMVGAALSTEDVCTVRVDPFVLDEASRRVQVSLFELGREETPEQEDVGALFADEVHLSCE
ncbi:MAG: DUF1007 family protein [Pseudomonadota bacterium]